MVRSSSASMSTSDSSLYWACFQGDKHRALTLANQDNVNYVLPHCGETPLHQACKQGWLDVVELLIEKYCGDPNVKTKTNESLLHYACRYNHTDIVKLLIENYGCDPNVVTKSNQTLLHYVCWYGSVCVTEYLISEHHLNPLLRDNDLLEPLDYALKNNQAHITVYLCQHCISSDKVLSLNRMDTTVDLIQSIIKFDPFNPQWKTSDGDNILQLVGNSKLCISHLPSAIVLKVLDSGAVECKNGVAFHPNWRTADGDNLLELACQSESYHRHLQL